MKRIVLMILLSLLAQPVLAERGTTGSGGGVETGIDFKSNILEALKTAKSLPEIKDLFDAEAIEKKITSGKIKVIVTDEPVYIIIDKIKQPSTASNDPDRGNIVVNEDRWEKIPYERVRQALALHEVLSVEKIEKSAVYHISSRYLNHFGYSLSDLSKNWANISRIVSCDDKDDRHFSVIQDDDDIYQVNLRSTTAPMLDGDPIGRSVRELAKTVGLDRWSLVVGVKMSTDDCHDINRRDSAFLECGGTGLSQYAKPGFRNKIDFVLVTGELVKSPVNFKFHTERLQVKDVRSTSKYVSIQIQNISDAKREFCLGCYGFNIMVGAESCK